jgi:hypothetical protein
MILNRRSAAISDSPRTRRTLLEASVQGHLLPALRQRGFQATPVLDALAADRDRPFGRLFRPRGSTVDRVEIQFSRYGRVAFRINACAVPRGGMMTPAGHRTMNDVLALGIHNLEMYAHPRWFIFFSLFSMAMWRIRLPKQEDYDKLAQRVAGFLPELESALREGELGPHMRRLDLVTPVDS